MGKLIQVFFILWAFVVPALASDFRSISDQQITAINKKMEDLLVVMRKTLIDLEDHKKYPHFEKDKVAFQSNFMRQMSFFADLIHEFSQNETLTKHKNFKLISLVQLQIKYSILLDSAVKESRVSKPFYSDKHKELLDFPFNFYNSERVRPNFLVRRWMSKNELEIPEATLEMITDFDKFNVLRAFFEERFMSKKPIDFSALNSLLKAVDSPMKAKLASALLISKKFTLGEMTELLEKTSGIVHLKRIMIADQPKLKGWQNDFEFRRFLSFYYPDQKFSVDCVDLFELAAVRAAQLNKKL